MHNNDMLPISLVCKLHPFEESCHQWLFQDNSIVCLSGTTLRFYVLDSFFFAMTDNFYDIRQESVYCIIPYKFFEEFLTGFCICYSYSYSGYM